MAECVLCRKKGFFLRTNAFGVCKACEIASREEKKNVGINLTEAPSKFTNPALDKAKIIANVDKMIETIANSGYSKEKHWFKDCIESLHGDLAILPERIFEHLRRQARAELDYISNPPKHYRGDIIFSISLHISDLLNMLVDQCGFACIDARMDDLLDLATNNIEVFKEGITNWVVKNKTNLSKGSQFLLAVINSDNHSIAIRIKAASYLAADQDSNRATQLLNQLLRDAYDSWKKRERLHSDARLGEMTNIVKLLHKIQPYEKGCDKKLLSDLTITLLLSFQVIDLDEFQSENENTGSLANSPWENVGRLFNAISDLLLKSNNDETIAPMEALLENAKRKSYLFSSSWNHIGSSNNYATVDRLLDSFKKNLNSIKNSRTVAQ